MWKFLSGENFCPSALIGEMFITQFFCPVLMITKRIWLLWRKFIPPNTSAIQM